MNKLCSVFVATLFLLVAAPAAAQQWPDAFDTTSIETYLPEKAARVVVVPTGDNTDESAAAADALSASIDAVEGTTAVVVSGVGKGAEDDAKILERAEALSADAVLIVRVFQNDGEPPVAVATMYDRSGEAFSAFAVAQNEELSARRTPTKQADSDADTKTQPSDEPEEAPEKTAPSEGVSSGASEAVESVSEQQEKSMETRLTALKSRILLVRELKLISGDGSSESRMTFYKGVYQKEISPEQFFEELDEPELATQYKRNKRFRLGASIASVAGLLGGAALATHGAVQKPECGGLSDAECDRHRRNMNITMIGGATAFTAGIVGLIIIEATSPLPVSPSEARELAYDHNVDLAEELGVPESVQPFAEEKPRFELDVGFGPMGDGAGAVLFGRF